MDTVLQITMGQLVMGFLGVCGGITTVAAAIGAIYRWVKMAKAPNERQNERLDEHDKILERHEKMLKNDNERMHQAEEGSRLTMRSLFALLSYNINGQSDTKQMQEVRDDLQKWLINK
jgi:hypothetical protein